MTTFQTVHCATVIIYIIILLTERCDSRNIENNVQFILNQQKNVQFVKKLRLNPDKTVKQNNNNIINNNKLLDLDIPVDILEEKDVPTQYRSKYLKIEKDNKNRDKIKNRVSRQINNGYSSVYPSLAAFNQNGPIIYTTPYKTPGTQYYGSPVSPPNSYKYPSNINSSSYLANHNRYPQNATFQANVPSLNFSSKPSYYPHGQNLLPNNSTSPNYIQNSWYNPSSVKNSNRYNHYNNSYNYALYSNTTNLNSGSRQPNNNQFYSLPGKTNNTNIHNTPNVYNEFTNATRTNPAYNSGQTINGPFNPQPFGSSKFSTPSYPPYRQSAVTPNLGSNFSHLWESNPYYTPKPQISNQTHLVNPNSNPSNYKNQQTFSQNNNYNNPQSNSYFTSNKNPPHSTSSGTTFTRPNQNNTQNINQRSYIQSTPTSIPYFRPNTGSQNSFGSNQSWTEPNHFFYTPGRNLLNGSDYNSPHKYYK